MQELNKKSELHDKTVERLEEQVQQVLIVY